MLFIFIQYPACYIGIPPHISDPLPPVKSNHFIIKLDIMIDTLKIFI